MKLSPYRQPLDIEKHQVDYYLPDDAWLVVCDALAMGTWLALCTERDEQCNEARAFAYARHAIRTTYRYKLKQGRIVTNSCDLMEYFFAPNFKDAYMTTSQLSDEDFHASQEALRQVTGLRRPNLWKYRHIYGDRAKEIITMDHPYFNR